LSAEHLLTNNSYSLSSLQPTNIMKFSGLFAAAALLASSVSAKALDSFAEGGNLPKRHIAYGSEGRLAYEKRDVIQARAKAKSSSTSSAAAAATSSANSTTSTLGNTADSKCVNTATTRNCWGNGFSVDTDFDQKWPTTGVTRYYTLTVSNTTCAPDGSNPRKCFLINGQFPGPLIRANWGDNLQITVNNNMKSNGTAIHWHGLRQLSSTTQDGVNGITECPIAPGTSRTYKLQATQFGTTWYHSHHAAQYGDGIVGPLVIDGPTSDNWDIDLGPMTVQDWFYMSATDADYQVLMGLQQQGPGPAANNILINGTNMNPAGTTGKYLNVKLTAGKKHLLRIINTSVDNAIRVSLDGHQMEVITSDLVPVKPVFVQSVLLNVGQRYEVIINANQLAGNYWLRAEPEATGCFSFNEGSGFAIFTYAGVKAATPTTTSSYTNGGNCLAPSPLTPWVSNQVGNVTEFLAQVNNLPVGLAIPGPPVGAQIIGGNPNMYTDGNVVVWGINGTSMDVNWGKPVIQYVMEKNNTFPRTENLIELAFEGEWVFWIIQNIFSPGPPPPHPIHLHGHDFYELGSGQGTWTNDLAAGLTFDNPTRRDTATLPSYGWLALAFPTDNPVSFPTFSYMFQSHSNACLQGAWLMHCHIAWHISEGLGLQFLEAASQIANLPVAGDEWSQTCTNWNNYWSSSAWPKFGSGL
jgi:FtsP/CotA-like multicopper oxidase with cupredoxin domain